MGERKNSKNGTTRVSRLSGLLGSEALSRRLFVGLTLPELAFGVALAALITFLVVGYEFQTIPTFREGDIADRTIEAPMDFTVVDEDATEQKRQEVLATVPAVFQLNLRINSLIESELRTAFGNARSLIAEERQALGLPPGTNLPGEGRERVRAALQQRLPRFNQGDILDVLLRHAFNPTLENQMVRLLQESMKHPGVILSRELLMHFQNRGIILRNSITGQDESVSDWMSIRDLSQARETLRQNEYELTAVSGEDKRRIIAFLDGWIVPNVDFSDVETTRLEQLAMQEVDPVLIQVKRGRTIVRAGDEITARQLTHLEQLKERKDTSRVLGRFIGVFLLTAFFCLAPWLYFHVHQQKNQKMRMHYFLVAVVLVVSVGITGVFVWLGDLVSSNLTLDSLQNPSHFYLLAPLALGAILVFLLLDINLALLFTLVFSVLAALMTGSVTTFVHGLTTSLAAIYMLDQYRERTAVIRAGFVVGLVNVVTALALQMYLVGGGFEWVSFTVRSGMGLLSGLIAAMLASLLLPVLESLFKITTDFKLLELSNLNKPILRRLALEAPGTYHHSIIVGTLAEAAAEEIGANALLTRVGAYYHDIGKLRKPEYYIENQIYCGNKHESLSPSMSSLILASHVKDGLALADEVNLPPKVRDLIPEHHGTRLMTYFFQKAREAADDKHRDVDENEFRYPGPKPQSKEGAILMLADQVEAAARTLQDPSPGQLRSLIRRLVQSTIQDRQFDECEITMQDLERMSRAFERVLTGMYHHRIEYPGYNFNRQVETTQPQSTRIQ